MHWVTISIIFCIVIMLIIGVLVMYHTKAFWGLESNSNANTINVSMNILSSYTIYPIIVVIIITLFIAIGWIFTVKGFS